MNIKSNRLIPIAFFSSLGAPTLYLFFIITRNIIGGRNIDIVLIFSILIAALGFSLVLTMGLTLITIGIAKLLKINGINVELLSMSYVFVISISILMSFGFKVGIVFLFLH